jgi:protein O-mannosyl-transferase
MLLAVFAVYWPALNGQFLWDDFLVVHRNPLVTGEMSPQAIWFHMDFPLTYATFWLEWLAWGNHPVGYHVVNVLLHTASALLLWRVLVQLRIPAPWLAAMLFAVHPLCVASVAWISELKNTLSLPFFLLSLLLYVETEPTLRSSAFELRTSLRPSDFGLRISTSYCLSLLAFALALLSKTSTVMLPMVLVACAWWQRGRITWRDGLRASPFFLMALVFGLMSIWFQAHGAIAGATVQSEHFWGRLAAAGMALWFYLGKALLPLNLCMIYPRWQIDAGATASYLPLLLWCGILAACWPFRRTWGRHVLLGLGCFTVMLFPVLGFFDMYFLMLSRVSDHFMYLPLTALVALTAAGLGYGLSRMFPGQGELAAKSQGSSSDRSARSIAAPHGGSQAPSAAACRPPSSSEPSMPLLTELERIPGETRGYKLAAADGAIRSAQGYEMFVRPGKGLSFVVSGALVLALAVLAMLRAQVFISEEALWRDTLARNSAVWLAHANLGWILASQQKYDEAKAHLVAALELNPTNAQAHSNLGRLLSLQGKPAEAEAQFQTALSIKPKDADIRRAYAAALAEQGRREDAVTQFREALRLRPDTETRLQLATFFAQSGKPREAVAEYCEVLVSRPDQPEALNNVAWLLATCADGTVRKGAEAVRLAEHACRLSRNAQPRELGTLAAAYAEAGHFPQAVETAQKAVDAAKVCGNDQLAAMSEQLLILFRSGKPYHEPPPTTARPGTE